MKKIVIEKTKSNFTKPPFLLGILTLAILSAAIGWQTVETRISVTTPPQSVAPMPNLDGEKAKQYLEEKGLDKSLGEAILAAQYSVNWIERSPVSNPSGAYEAKNMQQEFAAYFTGDAVNMVSRVANEKWNLSLKFKGYGRGEQIESVGDGEIKIEKNRVEISKSKIVEWFENKPEGLEQGFNVLEKPSTDYGAEDLRLVLDLTGDLLILRFKAAVKRTAKEFPTVKKVIVCVNGMNEFGIEMVIDAPVPCPKDK